METSLPSGGGLTFHGAAGFGRDDIDDGSLAMGVRFQHGQCPAGRGRTSGALLVIHLCVWLLHPDGVLFRVPSSRSPDFGGDGSGARPHGETDCAGAWPPEGS
jgi:hypothetical protein